MLPELAIAVLRKHMKEVRKLHQRVLKQKRVWQLPYREVVELGLTARITE